MAFGLFARVLHAPIFLFLSFDFYVSPFISTWAWTVCGIPGTGISLYSMPESPPVHLLKNCNLLVLGSSIWSTILNTLPIPSVVVVQKCIFLSTSIYCLAKAWNYWCHPLMQFAPSIHPCNPHKIAWLSRDIPRKWMTQTWQEQPMYQRPTSSEWPS